MLKSITKNISAPPHYNKRPTVFSILEKHGFTTSSYPGWYHVMVKLGSFSLKLIPMVFILDGCLFHYAHTWSKSFISIF